MTSPISALLVRLREYWRVPLGCAVVGGGIAVLWSLADRLNVWEQAAGWALLAVTAGALMHGALSQLLGPVFAFDAIRTARRSRFALLRALYALLLLFVLFVVYAIWFGADLANGPESLLEDQRLPANEQARFAASFFNTFLVVQFGIMLLLVPVFTAGAIAEEREKGTLDMLLTTALTGREIILGKLAARVSNLILLLLAGVPILALLQLLGGVDPALLVAAFVYTLATMVSMGSICLIFSTRAKRLRQAVYVSYFFLFGYQLGVTSGAAQYLMMLRDTPGLQFIVGTLASSSVVFAYVFYQDQMHRSLTETGLGQILLQYLLFHGVLTVICVWQGVRGLYWSMNPKEKKKRKPSGAKKPPRPPRPPKPPKPRPPLKDGSPVMWKELHVDPAARREAGGKQSNDMKITLTAMFWVLVGVSGLVAMTAKSRASGPEMVRYVMLVVLLPTLCLTLLQIALHASGTISGERDRQTLDSLLTTDLENGEILKAKWLSSLLLFKWAWLVMLIFVGLGVVLGGFPFYSVPTVVLCVLVQAAFAVCLGMYCSATCVSGFRATTAALVTLLVLTMGHWLLYLVGAAACRLLNMPDLLPWLKDFHTYGLTPPLTLSALATMGDGKPQAVVSALFGVLLYGVAAGLLWWRTQCRFVATTGRVR